jgi:hypothetical protein
MRNLLIIGAIAIILGLFSLVLFGQNNFFQVDQSLANVTTSSNVTLPKIAEANAGNSTVANTQPPATTVASSSSIAQSSKPVAVASSATSSVSMSASSTTTVVVASNPSMTKPEDSMMKKDDNNLARTGGAPDPCQQDPKSALCGEYKEYLVTKKR